MSVKFYHESWARRCAKLNEVQHQTRILKDIVKEMKKHAETRNVIDLKLHVNLNSIDEQNARKDQLDMWSKGFRMF